MFYIHKSNQNKGLGILSRLNKQAVLVSLLLGCAFGCQKEDDTSAPLSITSTNIVDGATEVDVFSEITVLFSEEMDMASVNENSFVVKKGKYPIYGKVSCSGTTAVFKPTQQFVDNTEYNCTIGLSVQSINGQTMAQDYHWSFTSGVEPDLIMPTIEKSTPSDMEISVFRDTEILVYFDEEIDPASLNRNSFIVKTGETVVSGSITYDTKIAKFVPDTEWIPEMMYNCTITRDVKDLAGNKMANQLEWSFTSISEVLSFSGLIQPIFEDQSCTSCHNGSQDPDLRESSSHASLVSGNYVNVDSPDDSRLMKQLKGRHLGFVTQKEEDLILEWIKRGAKNN